MPIIAKLRGWLRASPRVHLREVPAHDLRSCVELLDRFLDDDLKYPLEWDDFVSWPHEAPGIECIRQTVAATEPLVFSKDAAEVSRGIQLIVAERNRVAALVGMSERAPPN